MSGAGDEGAEERAAVRSCAQCGTQAEAPGGGAPLGWSMGIERGLVEYLCAACTRLNIRSIEGKLSTDYWD